MGDSSKFVCGAQVRVGAVLKGKYTLDGLIGVGGMAAVYAATHRNRNRVAVKVLQGVAAANASVRSRFLREGYLANTVNHAGAVRVLDEDVLEDGTAFLVMELLEGSTLKARCQQALTLDEVFAWTDQLLDVLAAAHAKGIVHRDIKPDNLFLLPDLSLKVLDFGIARLCEAVVSGGTAAGALLGTPGFMAPELALGRIDEVDATTDIFAVGATLFWILSGQYAPGDGLTTAELIVHAATRPARSLGAVCPTLPAPVVHLVDRALRFDKRARWPDARSMQMALRATREEVRALGVHASAPLNLADAGTIDQPVSKGRGGDEPSSSWSWRRVSLIGIAAAVLIVVGVRGRPLLGAKRASAVLPASAAALPPAPPTPSEAPSASTVAVSPSAGDVAAHVAQPVRPAQPRPRKKVDCTPNFVLDEDGSKHFKPECFP